MLYKSMLQYTRVHFSARVVVAVQISNLGKNVMVQTVHMYRRKITGSKHHPSSNNPSAFIRIFNKIYSSITYNVLLKRRISFFFRPNKLFHNENGPLITPKNGQWQPFKGTVAMRPGRLFSKFHISVGRYISLLASFLNFS